MSGDTQATFSKSVKNSIREKYSTRCAICLSLLPVVGTQSAPVLDSAALHTGVDMGLLSPEYERGSATNGMAQCAGCQMGFFTPNLIALSPSLPVLKYIFQYLVDTEVADRKPLYQVFGLLRQAMAGQEVALPDLTSILPYLQLFNVVVLMPDAVDGRDISTQHMPRLSILQDNRFVFALTRASPRNSAVARIFDVLALNPDFPKSLGLIPLSPKNPEFRERRYWRLPVPMEAVLVALMDQVKRDSFESEEISCAQSIFDLLGLQARGIPIFLPPGGGPSGQGRSKRGPGGGGPSGNQSGVPKRDLSGSKRTESRSKRGRKGDDREPSEDALESCSAEAGESVSETTDRSVSPERTHHGVAPQDWEVSSSFSTFIDGGGVRTRSPSQNSAPSLGEFGSEDGTDDPKTWKFGPSYRSDMIIVAARGISLV